MTARIALLGSEKPDKIKLRDTLQNNQPILFKNVKVGKQKNKRAKEIFQETEET